MVPHGSIVSESNELFFDVLPQATVKAFKKCVEINFLSLDSWYLAGGTALALQVGHRRSVDLDFFTSLKAFDEKKVEETMSLNGDWITTSISTGTVFGEFFGAKMSFIAYPFFKTEPPLRTVGTVSILSPRDIAVMKIVAISQRGKKRDFFDLYWLCHNGHDLQEIILRVEVQYSVRQNTIHIYKSLVYFDDAESDPEPNIYFDADWKKIKQFFIQETSRIVNSILQ